MIYFYRDTSALVKRYHSEPGSAVVNQLFKLKTEKVRFLAASWALLEFEAAFDQIKRKAAGLTDQHKSSTGSRSTPQGQFWARH